MKATYRCLRHANLSLLAVAFTKIIAIQFSRRHQPGIAAEEILARNCVNWVECGNDRTLPLMAEPCLHRGQARAPNPFSVNDWRERHCLAFRSTPLLEASKPFETFLKVRIKSQNTNTETECMPRASFLLFQSDKIFIHEDRTKRDLISTKSLPNFSALAPLLLPRHV